MLHLLKVDHAQVATRKGIEASQERQCPGRVATARRVAGDHRMPLKLVAGYAGINGRTGFHRSYWGNHALSNSRIPASNAVSPHSMGRGRIEIFRQSGQSATDDDHVILVAGAFEEVFGHKGTGERIA